MTTRRAVIFDGHYSGRFTATYDQWLGLCDEMRAEGCERFSLTECGGTKAKQALAHWAHNNGWDLVHFSGFGESECAILSDPSVLNLLESEPLPLTSLTLTSARKAPMVAPVARYEHIATGAEDWRSVAHLPAHLEGPDGFKPGQAAKVHRSAVDGWKQGMKGREPRTLMFDSNVNLRLPWVRDWLDQKFPRLVSAWGRHLPSWGTFQRRVIDLVLTTLRRAGRIRRVDHMPGFDHVGFVVPLDMSSTNHRWQRAGKKEKS